MILLCKYNVYEWTHVYGPKIFSCPLPITPSESSSLDQRMVGQTRHDEYGLCTTNIWKMTGKRTVR